MAKQMKVPFGKKLLIGVLSAIFFLCLTFVVGRLLEYRADALFYQTAQNQFVSVADPNNLPEDAPGFLYTSTVEDQTVAIQLDFEAMKAANPDIIGWVWVPDSTISYPLLQGDNNQDYLYKNYDGGYSASGSVFMDYRNRADLSDLNTIIYGHNMRDGSMFGTLRRYTEADYMSKHRFFYVLTENACYTYKAITGFVTDVYSETYQLYFENREAVTSYVQMLQEAALVDIELSSENRFVTLSTCTSSGTYSERYVVVGVQVEEDLLDDN